MKITTIAALAFALICTVVFGAAFGAELAQIQNPAVKDVQREIQKAPPASVSPPKGPLTPGRAGVDRGDMTIDKGATVHKDQNIPSLCPPGQVSLNGGCAVVSHVPSGCPAGQVSWNGGCAPSHQHPPHCPPGQHSLGGKCVP